MNREEAINWAKQRDVDVWVRVIARSGKWDESRINCSAKWRGFEIHATFGAGVNGAEIRASNGFVLYYATNYGKHIEKFHPGKWVDMMIDDAKIINSEMNRKAQEEKQKAEDVLNEQFREISDEEFALLKGE